PAVDVEGETFQSEGYDPAQWAFVVARKNAGESAALMLSLQAKASSPVVNPAIVIRNWGDTEAQLKFNGKPVNWGKDFRRGYIKRIDGTDLVVWIRQTSSSPLRLELTPVRRL